MAKKQKSFADKASGNQNNESVFVKYVKSIQSEETGGWRFNEQIVKMQKGEQLDSALKKINEVANLVDIDLSEFSSSETLKAENSISNDEVVLKSSKNEVANTVSKDELNATANDKLSQEEE